MKLFVAVPVLLSCLLMSGCNNADEPDSAAGPSPSKAVATSSRPASASPTRARPTTYPARDCPTQTVPKAEFSEIRLYGPNLTCANVASFWQDQLLNAAVNRNDASFTTGAGFSCTRTGLRHWTCVSPSSAPVSETFGFTFTARA
jgi:hypothetical protein